MATTEIEKLERRYAENPQGLTFAPLAEVHRKNGDVARALDLLRAGLELHPNYIPASIVLGRCHWDQGDLPAAESAFSHVLRLDDENVIALKSLADINERLERFSEAQRWLNRLISVDRSNEEARQQLARLEAAKQQPAPAAVQPRDSVAAQPAPVKQAAQPEPVKKAPSPPVEPVLEPPGNLPAMDLTAAIAEPPPPAAPAPPAEAIEPKAPVLEFLDTSGPVRQAAESSPGMPEEKPAHPEEPMPVEGLVSQEFVPPKDSYRSHPELTQEFVSAREDFNELEVETTEEVELQSSGASEFRVPNAAEDFMELSTPSVPASEFRVPNASEEFRELATPPVSAPVPAPEPAPRHAVPEPERSSYSVRETKGQSVSSFFQAMLAARPPGTSLDGSAPAGPAQDAVALSSVLGEASRPVPPAEPGSAPPPDAAVSFDDFFGAPAGGSSPQPTESGKDDLDQFQSWLQNLKR
jgi:hypothetical protein